MLELDALRGIAALAVVFYHYFFRYNEIYGHPDLYVDWSSYGKLGVQLFFMVSGFVIFWTLNRVNRPLDFIVSRFSRLYPTYWVAVATTFFFIYVFTLPGREVTLGTALFNGLMFHGLFGVDDVDGVYWTLLVELTFYFWMFLFYYFSRLGWVELALAVIVIFSVLHSAQLIVVPSYVYKIFIMRDIPQFLAGICIYKIVNVDKSKLQSILVLCLCLISTLFIYSTQIFIVFSFFYLIFYAAVSGKLKILSAKPLVFLGGISYSLYLLHQNIGYILINIGYQAGFSPVISIFVALCLVILLSTFFMIFIERPSLVYIREYYKNNVMLQSISAKFVRPKVG